MYTDGTELVLLTPEIVLFSFTTGKLLVFLTAGVVSTFLTTGVVSTFLITEEFDVTALVYLTGELAPTFLVTTSPSITLGFTADKDLAETSAFLIIEPVSTFFKLTFVVLTDIALISLTFEISTFLADTLASVFLIISASIIFILEVSNLALAGKISTSIFLPLKDAVVLPIALILELSKAATVPVAAAVPPTISPSKAAPLSFSFNSFLKFPVSLIADIAPPIIA